MQAVAHWPGLLFAQRLEPRVLDEVPAQVLPRITVGIAMPVGSLLRRIGVQRAALVPAAELGFATARCRAAYPADGYGTSPDVVPLSGQLLGRRRRRPRCSLLRAADHTVGAGRGDRPPRRGSKWHECRKCRRCHGHRAAGRRPPRRPPLPRGRVRDPGGEQPLPWAPSEVRRTAKLAVGTAPLTGVHAKPPRRPDGPRADRRGRRAPCVPRRVRPDRRLTAPGLVSRRRCAAAA